MRKALLILLTLAALPMLVDIRTAEAKTRDKSWELGAFATHVDASRENGIDNSYGEGINVGYSFTSKVSAELFITRTNTDRGGLLSSATYEALARGKFVFDPNTMSVVCTNTVTCVEPQFSSGDEMTRTWLQITGNFLTDHDTKTVPYISAGMGVIQEKRDGYPYLVSVSTDLDPNTPNVTMKGHIPESFDSSALLTLAVGARTFFSNNWGIRYEARYNHQNSFDVNQDEYMISVGAAWLIGGEK